MGSITESSAGNLVPKNLVGKTAIVTGSSRGIGAGIAIELGRRGANVVVNYTSKRGAAAAEKVIAAIEESGSRASLVQANVAKLADLEALVEAAVSLSPSGKVDILVHNAGISDDCYLADMTEEFYENQSDINLKAPIFLTHFALPHLAQGARIVLMSSVSARLGLAQQTVYAATKAAGESLCKVWATELGRKYSATVNCVSPGPISTDMWWDNDPAFFADIQPIIDTTPAAARVGDVGDVVPVVAFLCSEDSRWVTGSVVSASGGMSFIG